MEMEHCHLTAGRNKLPQEARHVSGRMFLRHLSPQKSHQPHQQALFDHSKPIPEKDRFYFI